MTATASVSGPELMAAVAWLGKLLPSRPTEPALGGLKIIITDEAQVILCAFDRNIVGSATLSGVDTSRGTMLVSGELLKACTRTLGKVEQVTLTEHTSIMELSFAEGTGWRLPLLPLDQYPAMPGRPDVSAECDAAELVAALNRVIPFVSAPDGQFHGAVSITGGEDQITIATTDGHRFGRVDIPADVVRNGIDEVLVPASVLQTAVAAMKGATERVQLRVDDTGVGFSGPAYSVRGPSLSVDMPWRKIDLGEMAAETVVVVDTAELDSTLDRVSVACDPEEAVAIDFTEEGIVIEPLLGTRASARHACETISHTGPEVSVSVKPKFLTGILGACGPYAEFGFAARKWHPVSIKACDEHGTPGTFRASLAQRREPKKIAA